MYLNRSDILSIFHVILKGKINYVIISNKKLVRTIRPFDNTGIGFPDGFPSCITNLGHKIDFAKKCLQFLLWNHASISIESTPLLYQFASSLQVLPVHSLQNTLSSQKASPGYQRSGEVETKWSNYEYCV